MELKNEDEFSDLFSGYTNVLYKGEVIGSIDGFSLNEFRDKEITTLEVTEYINKEEVKIGEIIIDLREN